MSKRMPPCATCGHGWALHVIPGGVENIDVYPHERHCVEDDCGCRVYRERSAPPWCDTCSSYRHSTANCGRDNCPRVDDATVGSELRMIADLTRQRDDAREQRDALRVALVKLVGVDGRAELEQLEAVMRLMPAPAEDKAATIDAIHALIATEGK